MPDFDPSEHWRVLLAITQGKDFSTIAREHRVSREEFNEFVRFVRNCQKINRKAWARWTRSDEGLLQRAYRERGHEDDFIHRISLLLGRSENAVRLRIRKLGLLPPDRRAA